MQIQTYHEIGFGYRTTVANFPETDWELSSVKEAICLLFFIIVTLSTHTGSGIYTNRHV